MKIEVTYQAGESRTVPGKAIDYMIAEVDDVELYAEAESQEDETATYDELRAAILYQATAQGIDHARLIFRYDEAQA